VAETGLAVGADVALHLFPVALVVADFFAVGADGDETAEGADVLQGFAKFLKESRIGPDELVLALDPAQEGCGASPLQMLGHECEDPSQDHIEKPGGRLPDSADVDSEVSP